MDAEISQTVEDQSEEPAATRPFPGNAETGQRRITPTAFAPAQQATEGETSYEKNVLKTTADGVNNGSSGLNTPGMAPPLRRRAQQKKRGFFKRLFGIR